MTEQDKSPSVLPLANIAALIALVGGVAFYLAPLTSSRPSVEPGHDVAAWGDQDVEARLWEDPLEVSGKHAVQLTHSAPGGEALDGAERHAHHVNTVRTQLAQAHPRDPCDVNHECFPMVLAVMVPGGPYAEQVEHRLRTRHAVVEGLSASHFIPKDYLHIGYFELDWPTDAAALASPGDKASTAAPPDARPLLVPYEWYQSDSGDKSTLLVLWLRDDAFADAPLSRLASLFTFLKHPLQEGTRSFPEGDTSSDFPVAIIGPLTSNDLSTMWKDPIPQPLKVALEHTEMYSAFASASEAEIQPDPAEPLNLADYLAAQIPGFQLHRTILTDDALMSELVKELKRRYVWTGPPGRVVLLAELDTVYGRGLPRAFEQALGDPNVSTRVETFFYPEGIDGRVPTDRKEETNSSQSAMRPDKAGDRPKEATEGADQSDYLRRLADNLRREDEDERWRREGGIEAVGVLGSDVFDKIMILRALRPSLPDTIFFTNTIDARLGHPSEWDATHNLVVASSFGLEPDRNDSGGHYPPFRDSYETSAFSATLQAMKKDVAPPHVHLYEIGLGGPFLLDDTQDRGLLEWVRLRLWLFVPALTVAALFGCWARARRAGKESIGRTKIPMPKDFVVETPLFLVVSGAVTLTLLVVAQSQAGAGGEPVAMVDGLSIWPSEALRLLVGLLGIHFVVKSMARIKKSNSHLSERFHLTEAPPRSLPTAKGAVAETTWRDHVAEGIFCSRVKRIWPPALAYFLFAFFLMTLLGMPTTPARGNFGWWANLVITMIAVLVTIFVLFFVIDAMLLNQRFITRLMNSPTLWPDGLLAEYRSSAAAGSQIDQCLAESLDINFIAERTAAIEPLIYYPFILIALMILSRLHYFDDWDFPISLIVVFGLNAAGAVFAAVTARRSAEYARGKALERLRKSLFDAIVAKEGLEPIARSEAAKTAAAARQAIDEIQSIHTGAFGPFAENPVVGALLLPGGAGLVAIAQHLLTTR